MKPTFQKWPVEVHYNLKSIYNKRNISIAHVTVDYLCRE